MPEHGVAPDAAAFRATQSDPGQDALSAYRAPVVLPPGAPSTVAAAPSASPTRQLPPHGARNEDMTPDEIAELEWALQQSKEQEERDAIMRGACCTTVAWAGHSMRPGSHNVVATFAVAYGFPPSAVPAPPPVVSRSAQATPSSTASGQRSGGPSRPKMGTGVYQDQAEQLRQAVRCAVSTIVPCCIAEVHWFFPALLMAERSADGQADAGAFG